MEQDQWLGMVGVYRRSLGLGNGLDWIGERGVGGNTRISNELNTLPTASPVITLHIRILCHGNHIEPPSVNRARSKTSTHHISYNIHQNK